MNKLLIGILSYNRVDFTKRCIESLYQNTDINDFDLIILDNGSNKETVDYLETLNYSNLRLCFETKNHGVAGGLNKILQFKKQDFPNSNFMKLDNDIIFKENTDKDWIKKINEVFEANIIIKIQNTETRIGAICIKPYTLIESENREINLIPEYSEIQIANWKFQFNPEGVLGCSTIFKKEIFDFFEKFDTDFLYGYEESLLHVQMIKKGYIQFFNKDICRVYHIDPGGETDYIKWKHQQAKDNFQKYLLKYEQLTK
jgi:GT2 family glycosyltransferase